MTRTSLGNVPMILAGMPNKYTFWWHTIGQVLLRMLDNASYPPYLQRSLLVFFYLLVLPEFGEDPLSLSDELIPTFVRPYSEDLKKHRPRRLSLLGPLPSPPLHTHVTDNVAYLYKPDSTRFVSYMTDDHSPVEFSCVFSADGKATVRFSIDPIRRQDGTGQHATIFFEEFAASMKIPTEALTWCKICANVLTVATTEMQSFGSSPRYPSQYFAGFDLSNDGISLKAYFLPETVAASTGQSKFDLLSIVVEMLSGSAPTLASTWRTVAAFFQSLPQSLTPSLEIVAVDCLPSHLNRLKVYVRTPIASLSTIRRFMTLDSTSQTSTVETALEQISLFWGLLFPGLADHKEPSVGHERPRHLTDGLLFYYELRDGYPEPFPKVYLPVRHLCSNDEDIVKAMEDLYEQLGNHSAMRTYGTFVRNSFPHRPLSARTGIHTYISFAVKPDKVEVTAYFNPECFQRN